MPPCARMRACRAASIPHRTQGAPRRRPSSHFDVAASAWRRRAPASALRWAAWAAWLWAAMQPMGARGERAASGAGGAQWRGARHAAQCCEVHSAESPARRLPSPQPLHRVFPRRRQPRRSRAFCLGLPAAPAAPPAATPPSPRVTPGPGPPGAPHDALKSAALAHRPALARTRRDERHGHQDSGERADSARCSPPAGPGAAHGSPPGANSPRTTQGARPASGPAQGTGRAPEAARHQPARRARAPRLHDGAGAALARAAPARASRRSPLPAWPPSWRRASTGWVGRSARAALGTSTSVRRGRRCPVLWPCAGRAVAAWAGTCALLACPHLPAALRAGTHLLTGEEVGIKLVGAATRRRMGAGLQADGAAASDSRTHLSLLPRPAARRSRPRPSTRSCCTSPRSTRSCRAEVSGRLLLSGGAPAAPRSPALHAVAHASACRGGMAWCAMPRPAALRPPPAQHTPRLALPSALYSRHPQHPVVRRGGRLQCDGDRPAGPQPGGPVQLLQPQVQPEDGAHAG